jgi:pimeloyl-ACP methyl ester carboxylesterase
MPRAHITAFFAGLLLLSLGAPLLLQGRTEKSRDVQLDGGPACPAAPVLVLEPAGAASSAESLVVFHGIGANRLVMLPLGRQFAAAGFRVYLVDSPGHGVNAAPFSFSANEACARGLLAGLEHSGEIVAAKSVLLGHSMGGGLVIRLADDFVAAGTIAIGAAPIVRPHRMPANLLLVAPQFDMPPILAQERELAAAAGGTRDALNDFTLSRAFKLLHVPGQTHTSPIFSARPTEAMVRWALNSVGATSTPLPPMDYRAFHGALMGLAGILLMFPAAVQLGARLVRLPDPAPDSSLARPGIAMLAWIAAGIFSALVVWLWRPLARPHLFGGDFLGSFLLIAGLPLGLACARTAPGGARSAGASLAAVLFSLAAALCTVAVVGGWCQHLLAELWLIPARWARLPLLAAAFLPISFAEECALGAPVPLFSRRGPARLLLFFLLRGICWVVMLAAFWNGSSAALLPVIFAGPLAGVSFGARLGTDVVRGRAGSPAAAAIFGAILNAWFVAAAFPLA